MSGTSTPNSRTRFPTYQITAFGIKDLPPMDLPPLPPITDQGLYDVVTTHSSMCQGPKTPMDFDPKTMVEDYEKLEHVGDGILGAMITVLLHDLFPLLGEGPATTVKGCLVSNATLARISDRYEIPQKLQAHPAAIRMTRQQVKTKASMFEAWIAGVFYSVLNGGSANKLIEDKGYEADQEGETDDEDDKEGPGAEAQECDKSKEKVDEAPAAIVPEVSVSDAPAVEEPETVKQLDMSAEVSLLMSVMSVEAKAKGPSVQVDLPVEKKDPSASESTNPAGPIPAPAPAGPAQASPVIEEPDQVSATVTGTTLTITTLPDLPAAADSRLKYRWLAMIAIDEWLRPLFTPIARYALAQLRIEQARLALIPVVPTEKPALAPEIIKENLSALGASAILNSYVQHAKAGSVKYEHVEVEEGWKVVCTLTQGDGSAVLGEGVRRNQKTAKALAAHRVCQQLGI